MIATVILMFNLTLFPIESAVMVVFESNCDCISGRRLQLC